MTLAYWQARLEKHFNALRAQRTSALGDKPLFALEHGLSEAERADLTAQIGSSVPQSKFWLPWAVYAAELGYDYDGDEYWQSFEKKTPSWLVFGGDRSWIRDCYWQFHKEFGGARPSGRWAQHFPIICWPIKHAVLPVDLQRQLAEILYEIRFSFRPELFESPELLGAEIAARSWRASSRFQNLTEEPLLVGQIAAALLLHEEELSRSLILPDTLLRIAKNLESERRAREWLRDAQAVARARMTGVVKVPSTTWEPTRQSGSGELRALGIEPSVFLRPNQSSWDVLLEIPDLAPLLYKFPALQRVLNESPCVVAGSSGRPLARGRLLHYGPQTVVLKHWPEPKEVLLRFEMPVPELDYLLSGECMLRPGPKWLFKVSPDGVAYEVRGKVIRPGERYVVLSTDGPLELGHGTRNISLGCEGVSAAYREVPASLDEEGLRYLKELGLCPATGVHIQPVGIPPVKWDGEGHVEWLSTDRPCISVSSNRPVSAICLNLEGPDAATTEIPVATAGEVVFMELGELRRGSHRLHVLVLSPDAPDQLLSGYVDVSIRDPRPWTKGLTDQNPLIVIVDPPNPSLEQLWSGRVSFELQGPPVRQVSGQLSFFQKRIGAASTFQRQLPVLLLPVDPATWRSYFSKIQQNEAIQNAYDNAARCELTFNAGEIGQFSLVCERESIPLRWMLRWENHGYVLQLQDDTGGSTATTVAYDFMKPDLPVPMNSTDFIQTGFRVGPQGGLYVAKNSRYRSGVVVPPVLRSLTELRLEPELAKRSRSGEAVGDLLSLMELWSDARVTGNLLSCGRMPASLEICSPWKDKRIF